MKTRKFYRNCRRRYCNSGCSRYVKCRRAYRLRRLYSLVSPLFNALAFIFKGSRRHRIAVTALSVVFAVSILTVTGVFRTEAPTVAYAANDVAFPTEVSQEIATSVINATNSAHEIVEVCAEPYAEEILDNDDDDTYVANSVEVPSEEDSMELFAVEEVIEDEQVQIQEDTVSYVITDELIFETAFNLGAPSDYDAPVAIAGMLYLVNNEGFTVEGAAGLIGNAYTESRFYPGADNGSHFGIFQWDYFDRWPKTSEYLESIGCPLTSRYDSYSNIDYETQKQIFVCHLEAALHSSDAPYYSSTIEYCRGASEASNSADRWRAYYEVCDAGISERITVAEVTADLYYSLYR